MKRIFLIVALALLECACAPQPDIDTMNMPASNHSDAGGINGGGGGTLPAKPVSTGDVRDIIRFAKPQLTLYIKFMERNYKPNMAKASEKLAFGERSKLLTVLYSTDIESPETHPCYDASGNPVDGSIHASVPNTICISAFTIAPKVKAEGAQTEILALVMHEMSHLLGANESQAQELQKQLAMMYEVYPGHASPDAETYLRLFHFLAESADDHGHKVEHALDAGSDEDVKKATSLFATDLNNLVSASAGGNLSFFDKEEWDAFDLARTRLAALSLSLDSADLYSAVQLETRFKGRSHVTYCEYMLLNATKCDDLNIFGDRWIERTTTRSEAKQVLSQILFFLDAFSQNVSNLNSGAAAHDLPLPASLRR